MLFDVQCFNFTYKLLSKQLVCLEKKSRRQMSSEILAAKELKYCVLQFLSSMLNVQGNISKK